MLTYALVAAGGSGKRMETNIPKQYLPLCGKPVLAHSLLAFQSSDVIDGIVISAEREWHGRIEDICREYGITKLRATVPAGYDRRSSVYNALRYAAGDGCEIVLVHDAARPLLDADVIERCRSAAIEFGASAVVIPASDTILRSRDGVTLDETPSRSELFMMQTPEAFKTDILLQAHDSIPNDANDITDDCSMVRRIGREVRLVPGSPRLIKITRPEDLAIAACLCGE